MKRRRRSVHAIALLGLVLSLAGAPPASAQTASDAPQWAYAMTHDLMSPYCPGRSLHDCPSPQADELRLWILTQAAAGASEAEVTEQLFARFGEQLRSAPKAEGWGLSAYLVPILFGLLGVPAVFWILRRMVGRGASSATDGTAVTNLAPLAPAAAHSGPAAAHSSPAAAKPAPTASDDDFARRIDDELGI